MTRRSKPPINCASRHRRTFRSTRPITPVAWRSSSRSAGSSSSMPATLPGTLRRNWFAPSISIGPVDLYQVTHHGMDISNHPTLVQTVAPVVAIMNNGPRKGGAPATVKLLKSIPSIQAAYQLHKNAATSGEREHRCCVDCKQRRSRRRAHPGAGDGRRVEVHRAGRGARAREDVRVAVRGRLMKR